MEFNIIKHDFNGYLLRLNIKEMSADMVKKLTTTPVKNPNRKDMINLLE
jgi:hypothetical protein